MTAAGPAGGDLPHVRVRFAHESERQFAQLLDFYGIAWEYEPRTFTLEADGDGHPTQAFSPDFYLPAYDLFLEITTLNQKLVTRKNRKVRLLRERHPEVNIKVLYQRDYLRLLVKYGLAAPEAALEADVDGADVGAGPEADVVAVAPPEPLFDRGGLLGPGHRRAG